LTGRLSAPETLETRIECSDYLMARLLEEAREAAAEAVAADLDYRDELRRERL
jgi:hypothetical protein